MKFISNLHIPIIFFAFIILINNFALCKIRRNKMPKPIHQKFLAMEGQRCNNGRTECVRGTHCLPIEKPYLKFNREVFICRVIPHTPAKKGEICINPFIQAQPVRQCDFGLECRKITEDTPQSISICKPMADNPNNQDLVEENGECSRPVPGYAKKVCKKNLVCRPNTFELESGLTGVSSYCLKPIARMGEMCNKPVPDFPVKECQTGLVCRPKTQNYDRFAMQMSGVSSFCLKPQRKLSIHGVPLR